MSPEAARHEAAEVIRAGEASLGLELGSTTIKACLISPGGRVLSTASHTWQSAYVDRLWTYSLDDVWSGIQGCIAGLLADVQTRHGVALDRLGAICLSAMMHGYLALDENGQLLVPFRTWRNTNTVVAAAELSRELNFNVPLRWSAAHLYQAVIDREEHVSEVARITTLAGYVHEQLTGSHVLGVGDASGVFPIDTTTGTYDEHRLAAFARLVHQRAAGLDVRSILPQVLPAGREAGRLTQQGALLLDPSGTVEPGVPFAPPEGDAGTGMVATNSIAPRTGNVSAGTSIFAMVVLERGFEIVRPRIDVVVTPAGDPVAMIHCNNGASELDAWMRLFCEFATAIGSSVNLDTAFRACLSAALDGEPGGGGLVAYNYVAGEPVTGLTEGRPLVARTPGSRLTLGNFMRTQVYSVFGTLSLGMRTLASEGVCIESMLAHGGMFKTAGVAQRFLSAALDTPVSVRETAGEGGAWGGALLADYVRSGAHQPLQDYLHERVFAASSVDTSTADERDRAGFEEFLRRYEAGLAVERAAIESLT